MIPLLALATFLASCAAVSTSSDSPRAETPIPAAVALAHVQLSEGQVEEAQATFAKLTSDFPRCTQGWSGFGEASFRLYQLATADPKRGSNGLYLQDAENGFRRAAEIDPQHIGAWGGLARVARERGNAAAYGTFAQHARDAIARDTDDNIKYQVLLELGDARAFEFLESARRYESPLKQADLYQRARDAYFSARAIRREDSEPILHFVQLDVRRGGIADAMETLIKAAHEAPEEYRYQAKLGEIAVDAQWIPKLVELYEGAFAKQAETSATTRWYAGFARIREAEKFRADKDYAASAKSYMIARDAFRKSSSMNAEFTKQSKIQEALCLAGEARILFENEQLPEAAALLTKALETDASIISIADGLQITPKLTSLALGGACFNSGDLGTGAEWFERWLSFSNDDVDWLNNAGLMRRDLGEKLAKDGRAAEAMASFEASYVHYKRAAELMPEEPRIVNDAALILLYHLHRDLDLAQEMFRRAARLGGEKLDALGGERPEEDENDPESRKRAAEFDYFAEATGDAWQNLALLLWENRGDSAEIRNCISKSLQLDPRGTRAWLRDDMKELPLSGPAPKRTKPLR
ncbi:MAG: hypothetical protein HY286_15675 [Planctomycetes bacterium]|nr:hypothetical protein [Planctomycetota bacterium]